MEETNNLYKPFKSALLDFNKIEAEKLLSSLDGNDKKLKMSYLVTKALTEIGDEWTIGEIALSQIYMSGRICEELVEKYISEKEKTVNGKSNIAIVSLMDYHLLGKKIVYSILSSSGIVLQDLGSMSDFNLLVKKVIENKIEILLISTLMLHTALRIKEFRALLEKVNYPLKIIVGGAPFIFDSQLWQQVGADAMGESPSDAIRIINQWKS